MVRRLLFMIAISFSLSAACAPEALKTSEPAEVSFESPSVELLAGEKDLGRCVSLLEGVKDSEALYPVDYVSLYYFLKAAGQRERAILAALEGFDVYPESPVSALLSDIIEEEMTFNAVTEKIAEKVMTSALERDPEDPVLKYRILRSLYVLATRKGDRARMESCLDRMGIPPGAFFEKPDEELPRTRFARSPYPAGPAGPVTRFARNSQFLNIPSTLAEVKGEYLGRMHVPFECEEGGLYYLLISSRSPLKFAIDGTPVFGNDPFSRTSPPINILKIRLEKGSHLASCLFHSVNSNEGPSFSILGRKGASGRIVFTGSVPSAAPSTGCRAEGVFTHPAASGSDGNDHLLLGIAGLFFRSVADYPRARLCLDKALRERPDSLLWKLALSELIVEKSFDLPESYALSRAEFLVDDILKDNPDCPEARYFKIYLKSASSQGEEFLAELRRLADDHPSDPRWFIQLSRELGDLGWNVDAKDVISRARSVFPQNSQVEEEWLNFCGSRKNRADQLEALETLSKLRIVPEEFEEYYASTGDYEKALEMLSQQQRIFGDPGSFIEQNKIEYLRKLGRNREGLKAVESLLEKNPLNKTWGMMKASLLFLEGNDSEANGILSAIKERDPSVFSVDHLGWLSGGDFPFESERIPLSEALENLGSETGGASSSYLLDHQVSRVYPDGSILERYHGVVAIHDRDGVEREGEQRFPSAYLLTLRTIKPDGTIVEPEIVPNKRSIGMSGLEVGDIVEYEYLMMSGYNGVKRGCYYTPYVFMFQDVEKPFARTCWSIKYPPSFKMSFYEQNLPAPPVETKEDGLIVRKYEYRSMPRLVYEPDLPSRNFYLPLVDAVGNLDWRDFALSLQNEVTGSHPVSLEISEKCGSLLAGLGTDAAKIEAIIDFVLSEIDGEGRSWGNPTETLLLGEGNRLQLAMAMLAAAGIRYDFLFAEPTTEALDGNRLPTEGRFRIPVLRVYPGGKTADYYLESRYRDAGILPWYLQGAKALSVTSPEPWKELTLGSDWGPWKACEQDEKRVFGPTGDLNVSLSQALDPDQGAQFRSAFKKLPKDRWKEVLQMAFAKQFGNVEIADYDFLNLDENEKSLVLKASAKVSSYASATGGVLRIEEPIDRLELMKNFGSLEKRSLPLSTGTPFIINQAYTLSLPDGEVAAVLPGKKKVESKYGSYSIIVRKESGGFTVRRNAFIPFQIVPPSEYPAFVSFLKQVDDAEKLAIEVKLR